MSVTAKPRPLVRRRRQPEEAREEALASARRLLLEQGPAAVTLKAVAADLGMTHTNLLHHFGSAADLQSALMQAMLSDFGAALTKVIAESQPVASQPDQLQDFVDQMFDAVEQGGIARLAAWLALSGNRRQIERMEESINGLVAAVEEKFAAGGAEGHRAVTSAVLLLTLCAFGDALLGDTLTEMLHRERSAPRKLAAVLLPLLF